MATINYKEKYEKVVRAAMLAKQDTESAVTIRILEEIFPELKDSDDERIRKALLEMVHDTTGDSLWVDYNVHKEECIAWLERQVEQKHTLQTDNVPYESSTDAHLWTRAIGFNGEPMESKPCEQKKTGLH